MEVMEAQFSKYFNQVNNAFYIGVPDNYKKLSIFPIFTDLETLSTVPYTKLENEVKITEVSDDGSVPQLLANNTSEFNVVIYEGEILEGLKQMEEKFGPDFTPSPYLERVVEEKINIFA